MKNTALIIAGCIAVAVIGYGISQQGKGSDMTKKTTAPIATQAPTKNADPTTTPSAAPTSEDVKGASTESFNPNKQYTAVLHTEKGDITIEFHKGQTPKTVENFVTLARKKFYDMTVFHRTIKGFMIQGGDPKGDGTGGPGYRFDDEPFTGEYTRGTIAMANAGPNTNGSQFFIMHADYPLPKNYTIFGRVTRGIEVVDAIATAPVKASVMGEMSAPATPVKILTIDITEE